MVQGGAGGQGRRGPAPGEGLYWQERAVGRGFLSGVVFGGLVSAVALMLASQVAERVDMTLPEPEAAEVEVPADSEFSRAREDADPLVPAAEPQPARETMPRVEAPDTAPPPMPDTSPAAAPETGAPQSDTLVAPAEADAPDIRPGAEDPVSAPAAASAPSLPATDAAPGLAAPSQAPTPTPTADPAPEAGTEPAPEPAAEAAPEPAPEPTPEPAQGAAADPPAPAGQDTPAQAAGENTVPPQPPAAPEAPAPDLEPAAPPREGPVEVADSIEGIRLPVPEIDEVAPGTGPAAPVSAAGRPAIEAHAEPFTWNGSAPLMSVILFDRPDARLDPAQLAGFPVPLTVALNPLAPDAATAMAAYRAAGVEVATLAPLPEGATPADVEVAFQTYLATMTQAVAVLDSPEAQFQENRPRAAQIAEILAASGHGLITYDRGLNAALQLATQEGVPASTVLRAFDDGARDVGAMKRFLDDAAFRAGQEGAVIVTGVSRPEVLTALSEWVLGTRAAGVTLAPVSGLLNTMP